MEVYIFVIAMSLLVAFGLIGIGICIGRTMESNEGFSCEQFLRNNNNGVLHNRDTDLRDCDLGGNDWK